MSDAAQIEASYGGRQMPNGSGAIVASFGGRQPVMQGSVTTIAYGAAVGSTVATIADPFAGLGMGATTYSVVGQGSPALALSSGAIVLAALPTYRKNFITIEALAGDGKTRIAQTLEFSALSTAGGSVTPTLNTLTLSSTAFSTGGATSVGIVGATAGSTITATSSDGTALTVSGTTLTGTFTTAGSPTITLVETLAGATGSPKTSTVGVVVGAGARTMSVVGRYGFIANTLQTAYTAQNIRQHETPAVALVSGKWKVVIPNFYVVQGGSETGVGAATVTASIEYPSGTFTQVTFGGSATLNQADGDMGTESDYIPLNVPSGATMYVRIFRQCAGGTFTSNYWQNVSGSVCELGTSGTLTDKTMGGALTQTFTSQGWAHAAIVQDGLNVPTMTIFGDSKAWGQAVIANPGGGEIQALMYLATPYPGVMNLAGSGSTLNSFIGSHSRRLALALKYSSNYVIQFGINDTNSGQTSAQMIANRQAIAAYFPDQTRVWQTTVGPGDVIAATSGVYDSYADQTPKGNDAARVALNDWVRSQTTNPFLEIAWAYEDTDKVVGTTNGGRWASPTPKYIAATSGNMTSDGTHPSNATMTNLIYAATTAATMNQLCRV